MRIETLFLDAGGVLVFPNWTRVSETLGRHGVAVSADALQAAEPRAKFDIDQRIRDGNTTDAQRAWLYMELVLENAGIALDARTAAALEELRAYHAKHNLWEFVPADVVPALQRLSTLGLKLVVVSNANGVLQRAFDRLGLTQVLRLHLRFVYRGRGEAGSALLPDCTRTLRLGRRLDDARRGPLLRGRGGRARERPAGDADRSLRPV